MSRTKNRGHRRRFLRRVRKRPVKSITLLPSLVTILNGIFGFASLVFASMPQADEGTTDMHFVYAAAFIFLGMIADMLDGQLARMSQSTSSFGGQLDSLCDVISFGIAPAFLMFKLIAYRLAIVAWANERLVVRFVWLAALTYVSCAVIRLARFNVENEDDSSDHKSFIGLPSPAAAGVIASLVLFHEKLLPGSVFVPYILPVITMAVGTLMVSRVRYPHVVNHYFKGKKPFSYLPRVLLALGLAFIVKFEPAMALLFCFFALSSPVTAAYRKLARPKKVAVRAEATDKPDPAMGEPVAD